MNNLSAGVQILIAQLKENPDQFFGSLNQGTRVPAYPKFHSWRQIIEEELVGIDYGNARITERLPHTWFLNEEEKEALADAFLQARRQRFDAEIITALTAEPEPDQASTLVYNTANRYVSSLAGAMAQTKEAVSSMALANATQ